jgi:hypothetical protein
VINMGYGTDMGSATACDLGYGYKDPRTGLCFENESIARMLGYGQPVDTKDTIVQVGSQGSFTQDHRLVTPEILLNPDANNAGYALLAADQMRQLPTSDAAQSYNALLNYVQQGSFTDPQVPYVRPAATTLPVAGPSGPGYNVAPVALTNGPITVPAAFAQPTTTPGTGNDEAKGISAGSIGIYAILAVIIVAGLFILSRLGGGK